VLVLVLRKLALLVDVVEVHAVIAPNATTATIKPEIVFIKIPPLLVNDRRARQVPMEIVLDRILPARPSMWNYK
jgi:hypothetical protein